MWRHQLKLHFLVLLWSFTGVLGKLISFQALELTFWRILFTFIILLVGLKLLGYDIIPTKKSFLKFVGAGMIIGAHWILFFGAIKASNVSIALSTLSTGALFSALLEPIFFRRKIALYEVILGFVVIICLFTIFQTSPEFWLGILMGIACSFLSALFSICNSFLQRNHTAHQITLYEMLGGFLLVSLFIPFVNNDFSGLLHFQGYDLLWLLILAGALTAYPMLEAVKLFRYFSPYSILLAINLEPVYGVILAFFIFGESEEMSPTFYVASGVMLIVIVINEIIKHRLQRVSKS